MNYRYGGGLLSSNKPMSQQDMALYNRYVKPAMQQMPAMPAQKPSLLAEQMTPQMNPYGFDVNENGEFVHPDGHVITPEMYQDMIERANPVEDTNFFQRLFDLYDEYMMKNAG